jgi:hypothetical protein
MLETTNISEDNFINLNKEYEKKVNDINLNIKKRNFKHKPNKAEININKLSFDDMSDILYTKKSLLNYKNYNYNIDFSNDIEKDIRQLLNTLNYDYFDDIIFKKVSIENDLNRFNPKPGEIIYYNCLRRDMFNQREFRDHIFLFENTLKKLNNHHAKNCTITFYEDDDLKIIWFILTIC